MPNHSLFPESSSLSVDDAKDALFPSAQSNLSVAEARQNLLAPINTLTPLDAKKSLVGNTTNTKLANKENTLLSKQQILSSNKQTGPSLFGIPHKFLSPENKLKSIDIFNQKQAQQKQIAEQKALRAPNQATALIPDEELDTPLGFTQNLVEGFGSNVADVIGGFVKLPTTVLNALDKEGITQDDLNEFKDLENIVESGKGIPNEKQQELLLEEDIKGSTLKKRSKFERIQGINKRQKFIDEVDSVLTFIKSGTNNKNTQAALIKLDKTSAKATKQIFESDGETLSGIGTFLGGIVDLATEDTAAAVEFTVQSLPQMYALAKNAILGISGLTGTEFAEAEKDFIKEHKRIPEGNEVALMGVLSLASAGLDTAGAKFVIGGKNVLAGGVKVAEKLGIVTAKATLDTAKEVVKQTTVGTIKKALGTAATPLKATIVEGSTEGAQNVLSQLASKQDISKVDPAKVLTDTTIGAVSGGVISGGVTGAQVIAETVSKTGKVKNKIKDKTAKVLNKVSTAVDNKLTKVGIAKLPKAVAKAKADNKPELGIQAITSVNFNELPKEDRSKNLKDLDSFIESFSLQVAEFEGEVEQKEQLENKQKDYEAQFDNLIQTHIKLNNGDSISETVEAFVNPDTAITGSDEVTTSIISKVLNSVQTETELSSSDANKVLGSTAFKKSATKKETKILKEYQEYQESVEVLKNTVKDKSVPQVNQEVLNGSKDGKFVGINQHITNIQKSIAINDKQGVVDTLTKLQEFRKAQILKLNTSRVVNGKQVPHTVRFKESLNNEINALTKAIIQAKNMGVAAFGVKIASSVTTEVPVTEIDTSPVTPLDNSANINVDTVQNSDAKIIASIVNKIKRNPKQKKLAQNIFEDIENNGLSYKQAQVKAAKTDKINATVINNVFDTITRISSKEAKVKLTKAEIKAKENIEYITQLKEINIVEEVIDENGVKHTLERNAGKTLVILDTRLDTLESIMKECG